MFRSVSAPFDYEEFIVSCHNPIPQPSCFFRRSAWIRAGGINPLYSYFFDWALWMQMGLHGEIVHDQAMISTYRLHPQSKTCGKVPAAELERVYREYFKWFAPMPLARREREAMGNMYRTVAGYYAANGEHWRAAWSRLRGRMNG